MKKEKIIKFISITFIILSLSMILLKYYKIYINKEIEKNSIYNYINKYKYDIPIKKEQKNSYNYIAILEIPTISLKKGIFNINNKNNHVDKNIQTLNKSQMPNIKNSNLILASHNGNSNVSYFKNLHKLKKNDLIYIYYEQYKYIYKFSYYYEVKKTDYISIIRDNNKTTLTLITCKNNSNDIQIVFISYLIDKEKI